MPLSEQLKATLEKIEEFLQNLEADAAFDGVFTTDEKSLIQRIFDDAEILEGKIYHILEDDHVSEEEKVDFMKFSIQIKYNAELVAGMDGKVTEDEKRILITLSKFIDSITL